MEAPNTAGCRCIAHKFLTKLADKDVGAAADAGQLRDMHVNPLSSGGILSLGIDGPLR